LKEHCEVGRVAQKLKKRKERKQKEFVFLGYSVDKTKNFVFVDDVVATGSTAKAVWLALGKPSLFHIWSLTYRPRLARTTFF
jgi:predicted amidophosphoribosyltransferase